MSHIFRQNFLFETDSNLKQILGNLLHVGTRLWGRAAGMLESSFPFRPSNSSLSFAKACRLVLELKKKKTHFRQVCVWWVCDRWVTARALSPNARSLPERRLWSAGYVVISVQTGTLNPRDPSLKDAQLVCVDDILQRSSLHSPSIQIHLKVMCDYQQQQDGLLTVDKV